MVRVMMTGDSNEHPRTFFTVAIATKKTKPKNTLLAASCRAFHSSPKRHDVCLKGERCGCDADFDDDDNYDVVMMD
jgi:hypothetical protein